VPITTLIDLEPGSAIAHYWAGAADAGAAAGQHRRLRPAGRAADLHGRNKGGKSFLTLEPADKLLPPVVVAAAHRQVACLARTAGCWPSRWTN
jgi:topoisomerase-4 subunit A